MAQDQLAYTLVQYDPPHDPRTAALITCVDCGKKEKLIVTGIGNNPEKINKLFIRNLGWDADVWHPSKNWCPRCVKRRTIRTQKELGVHELVASAEEIVNQRPSPPRQPPPEHFAIGAGTRTPKTTDPVTDMKKLTAQQKGLLRTAFESYFDSETGRYERDWSDQRVADQLQIARRIVEEFRDTFYGELQQDPEVAALVLMVEDAKRIMGNMQSTFQKIDNKMDEIKKKYGG